jgi:hypothetical protein
LMTFFQMEDVVSAAELDMRLLCGMRTRPAEAGCLRVGVGGWG